MATGMGSEKQGDVALLSDSWLRNLWDVVGKAVS